MKIRPMTQSDVPAVAEIEKECFSTPWSEEALADELINTQTAMLVCESDDGIVGYAGMRFVLDEGYINNVAVKEAFRRRGAANALLAALEEICGYKGLSFLSLEVRAGNAAAQRLYESRGYKKTGLRRGFYRLPREDAVIYTKFF